MPKQRPPWPKAILFDLDDTLWPIAPVIAEAEVRLFAWLQAQAPRVAAQFTIGQLRQARLDLLARQAEFHLDLGALRRAGLLEAFARAGEDGAKVDSAMALFHAARNDVTPYADVLPGLQRLGQRARLGSITNGNADLAAIGLDRHFSVSLSARAQGCAKPDAKIFHAACAALAVAPHEALYVGDDLLLDVQGAQRAGLRAVWLERSDRVLDAALGVRPDAVCASLDQLHAWLHAEHE